MKLFNFHLLVIVIRLLIVLTLLKIIRRIFVVISNRTPEITIERHADVLITFARIQTDILYDIMEVKHAKSSII